MISYAHKFYKLKGAERSLFVKAYMLSIVYSFYVLLVPKRIIFRGLGIKGLDSPFDLNDKQKPIVLSLEKSMRRAIRFLPWKIRCFARAITAKRILGKQNIPSTIYFGVAKDSYSKMIAHAWLRSGDIIVTGKEEMGRFTTILFFT